MATKPEVRSIMLAFIRTPEFTNLFNNMTEGKQKDQLANLIAELQAEEMDANSIAEVTAKIRSDFKDGS